MFLTIGILISDKDLDNLENLISQIKENVKIKNEIIICNNSSKEISVEDATVLNNGNGNIYQLRGRKLIINQAKGDYIWFVDGDDTVNEVHESSFFSDIIEFNFYLLDEKGVKECDIIKETSFITAKTNLVDDVIRPKVEALWNKFIKTSIYREVAKTLPDENISALEDWIFLYGSMKIAKTYEQNSQYIYTYNCVEASSSTNDYSNCFEKFERAIFGVKKGMELLTEITNGGIDFFHCPIEEFNARFYLKKVVRTKDDTVCLKMLDLICEVFSDEIINKISCDLLKEFETQEEFNRFVNIIQSRVRMEYTINVNGKDYLVSPDWFDFKKSLQEVPLYEDKDIEENPFVLNKYTGEVQIFSKKEDIHFWKSEGKKWRFIDNSVQDDKYIIHFSFGNACNLHCSYCFADKENAHELCLAENKEVIDKIFEIYDGKIQHIVLNNNGEPLFNSENFWEMYDYLKSKGLNEWQIQINTNGVDYSEKDIERFVERGGINVSIDGMKEIQDAHRGEGTYDSIIEDIQALKENGCNICATTVIMDDDKPIFDILEHLYKVGFTCHIFFSPARINGYWTEERKEKLYVRYEEFYKELEKRVCENKEYHWLSVFITQMQRIAWRTCFKNCPRYDYNFIDVDNKGNIFACYEEVGYSDKIIGNIFTSDMEELKNKRIKELKNKNFVSQSCIDEECPFINFCGGKNNMCEQSDKDMLCKIEKIKYKYLLRIYAYMTNRFLPEERDYLFEDSLHRSRIIIQKPYFTMLDKEFSKYWYESRNTQQLFEDGTLKKEDFEQFFDDDGVQK